MNRFQTHGLIGLAGVAVLATVDSALGLGGGALIADICRTILDEGPGGMADMPMEVKPAPLIALSLAATGASILALTWDSKRALAGRSAPDEEEVAGILSAMLIVATSQGRTSREEITDVFRIVTYHELSEDLVNAAYDRFRAMAESDPSTLRMPSISSSIGRRRTLAAALIMGCVARPPAAKTTALIESIALDTGATSDDVKAAKSALKAWKEGCAATPGVSPVMLLRHRALQLEPA